MPMHSATFTDALSIESRDLLERTLNWLEEDESRWASGKWATVVNSEGVERDLEKEELLDRAWQNYEDEREEYDEIKQFYNYKVDYPFSDVTSVSTACTVGALIVANGYKEDRVLDEAVSWLYNYLPEDFKSGSRSEDTVINFNDSATTSREDVIGLFRAALGLPQR